MMAWVWFGNIRFPVGRPQYRGVNPSDGPCDRNRDPSLLSKSARAAVDEGSVNALASSIADGALLNAITVRRVQKSDEACGAYEVIAGMHRVEAFRHRGGRRSRP